MRLRRSDVSAPGLTRVRSGRGYRYVDEHGATVRDKELRARITRLAIPPAWRDVWICPLAAGHIQATGLDDAGRLQYLYHEDWSARRSRVKFLRARRLAVSLPSARASVTRDLRLPTASRERALAVAFRLLDVAAPRLGGLRYLSTNGSHGLSTLECCHVRLEDGTVHLRFPAKSGREWTSQTLDPELARALEPLLRGPHDRLLAWREDDEWHPVSAQDINDDIRSRTHGDFTAKDFRTLHGTVAAALSLARSGPQPSVAARRRAVKQAAADAAAELSNTPATALKAYIDPLVIDAFAQGRTLDLSTGARPEHALSALLGPPD